MGDGDFAARAVGPKDLDQNHFMAAQPHFAVIIAVVVRLAMALGTHHRQLQPPFRTVFQVAIDIWLGP